MNAAAEFAGFASGHTWTSVPGDIGRKLLAHLVDTVAVMAAGAASAEASALTSCHGAQSQGCRVITRATRVAPADAALLNAFAGRRHTFDDTLEAGPIHPGSAVWAAALAAGEHCGAPLSRMLFGALCGYEIAVRLADALGHAHYDAGHHGTGTCNAPAAGMAAAVTLGLDARRVSHAINLAAAAAAGTRQSQIDGSIVHSALNGARAAATGVQSALFAAAGIDAPAGQLDGKWGFLRLFGSASPLATGDLGAVWGIRRLGLKPYPTCRFTHGPIEVLEGLRIRHGLVAEHVDGVEIRTFAQSASVADRPHWRGREEAILSHQFALAATLIEGPPELATLDRLARDGNVADLAGRIRVIVDPVLADHEPDAWPHDVSVTLRDGRVLHGFSAAPPGVGDSPAGRLKAESLIRDALGPARLTAMDALLAAPSDHGVVELTDLLGPKDADHGE